MNNLNKISLSKTSGLKVHLYCLLMPFLLMLSASGAQAIDLATDYTAVPPLVDVSASSDKPNVLMVLDNSNSMDEAANGSAVGSDSEFSKSEIARGALKTIINNFGDASRLGLMAYRQSGVSSRHIHNSPYDASFDPANFDASYSGPRDGLTKKYRIPNPTNSGAYIYYNIALPFYSGSNQGNAFCRSTTADFDNGSETVAGPWDYYQCYRNKTTANDDYNSGFSSYRFGGNFHPTDSDYAQGILDFGRFMSWHYVGRTWFSNSSPGKGMLHVDIADVDASHETRLLNKLATSQFTTSTDTPLRNAGLTPIEGTLQSAKSYFQGALPSSETASGASGALPPGNVCGNDNDYVVLVTDGLPSVDASGTSITDTAVAVAAAAAAAADLLSTQGVKTFVVGFALPNGVDASVLDQIAIAGGTNTAYQADDEASLNQALGSIFLSIINRTSSSTGAAVLANNTRGEGAVYQASYNPRMEDAQGRSVNWVGGLQGLFIDQLGYLREDSNGNKTLDGYDTDNIVEYFYDSTENRTRIRVFAGTSAMVAPDTTLTPTQIKEVSDLSVLWQARDQLASITDTTSQRDYTASAATGRHIVTSATGTGLTDFVTLSAADLAALTAAEDAAFADLEQANLDVTFAESGVNGVEQTVLDTNTAVSEAEFERDFRNDIYTTVGAFNELEQAEENVVSALAAAGGDPTDAAVIAAEAALALALATANDVAADKALVANVVLAEQAAETASSEQVAANTVHTASVNHRVAMDALETAARTAFNTANTAYSNAQSAYNGAVTTAGSALTARDNAVGAAATALANYNGALTAAGGDLTDPAVVSAQAALDAADLLVINTNTDLANANQAVIDRDAELATAITDRSDAGDVLAAAVIATDAAEDDEADALAELNTANQDLTDANTQLAQAQTDQNAYYNKGNLVINVGDLQTAFDDADDNLTIANDALTVAQTDSSQADSDLVIANAALAAANTAKATAQSAYNAASAAALNGTFLNYLMESSGTEANKLVNYIRGEEQTGYRSRSIDIYGTTDAEVWRLGDIVHSTPALVGAPGDRYDALYNDTTYAVYREQYKNRRQVVYVGANDGMLHAFNAGFWNESAKKFELDDSFATGTSSLTNHPLGSELWSYVPRSVLPHLKWLKDSGYAHSYYVDGEPITFDANIFAVDDEHPYGWGTVLAVGLRFGGGKINVDSDGDGVNDTITYPSYILMDVTNPEEPPRLIAEISHSELGFTTSKPALVKKRTPKTGTSYTTTDVNSWQLVFGSGPTTLSDATSTQNAKLFVYDLVAKSFVTGFAPNDLSSQPTSFVGDIEVTNWDNDFVDDTAYFGVIGGTPASPTGQVMRYRLDQSSGTAISTLVDTNRATVGKPLTVVDGAGRKWIYFGTGRLFDGDDNTTTPLQRYYGVMEPVDSSGAGTWASVSTSTLQDVSSIRIFDNGDLTTTSGTVEIPSGTTISSYNALKASLPKYKGGWYRNLYKQSSDPSGRNISASAKARSIVFFSEYKPAANVCQPEGTSLLYGVDYQTGTAVPFTVFGLDTSVTNNDGELSLVALDLGQGMASAPVIIENNSGNRTGSSDSIVSILTQSSTGVLRVDLATVGNYSTGRQSWSEIQLD